MEEKKKWLFFNNGSGWWLRITDCQQLVEYLNVDRTFSHAYYEILRNTGADEEEKKPESPIVQAIFSYARSHGLSVFQATSALSAERNLKMYEQLLDMGFINVNKFGGYNTCGWPMLQVEYREKLSFPSYTRQDIRIVTWKPAQYDSEREGGKKFHYYCYLGHFQLMDGDKVKWDTYQEAYDFALKFIDKEEDDK